MEMTKRKQTEIKVLQILSNFISNGFEISDTELIRVKELKSTLDFDGNYLISRIKEDWEIENKSKSLEFYRFYN